MKITDSELNIRSILHVEKGRVRPSSVDSVDRPSDCFVYVLSGSADYTFGGVRRNVTAGDVFYLAYESNYHIEVTDVNYTVIFVNFLFDRDGSIPFENEVYRSKGVALLEHDFEKLYTLWRMGDYSDKLSCKSLIYRIYSEVARSSFSQYVSKDRKMQMEQVVKYIAENTGSDRLDIPTLSRMCDMSEGHFRRIFTCIYHVSPIKYITLARINKARQLLTSDKHSISEISSMCGFQNPYYFSKVFKSETGMTPSRFKKSSRVYL